MKKILSLGLIGLLTLSMIACAPATNENVDTTETSTNLSANDSNEEDTNNDYYVSPTDALAIGEVITIGDIMMFDGSKIHIISGDLVEVFEYDNTNEKAFYIGQTVQLTKAENSNILTAFEQEDYTITHTNMGQMIEQITGKLLAISDDSISIETEKEIVDIKTYEASEGLVGDMVTAYVMSFDDSLSSILLINENSKLELTITAITRSNEGAMELSLTDVNGGEYIVNPSHASVEFDISKLEVNDILTVYHKGIMESWPMQLDTILIRK